MYAAQLTYPGQAADSSPGTQRMNQTLTDLCLRVMITRSIVRSITADPVLLKSFGVSEPLPPKSVPHILAASFGILTANDRNVGWVHSNPELEESVARLKALRERLGCRDGHADTETGHNRRGFHRFLEIILPRSGASTSELA